MSQVPSLVAPSSRTWLGIAREATMGTPVLPTNTIPLNKSEYEPEDMPHFLEDLAIRGSMSHRFADILGVEDANFSYGGPVFGDVWGYWLDNTFGDLSTTGSDPADGTSTTEALTTGGTTATVSSISGYSSASTVQIDSGSIAEVVILSTAPSGSTLTFANNPLRFAHANGSTVATVSAPFTHKFAVLNQAASVSGVTGAQAPAHTATDYTGLTAAVGARSYPSLRIGSLDFTGNSEQLLVGKISGNSWISAPASTTPTNTTAFTVPLPAWRASATVGGTAVYAISEFAFSIKRELGVFWTAQGAQNPYIIAQGDLDVTGSVKWSAVSDETALNQLLSNTQQALSVTMSNGLTGSNLISFTFSTTYMDVIKSKPIRSGVVVGYDNEFRTHANTTDVGGSGGLGQFTVTLENATPTY
jgi:hypothetical protein